MLQKKVTILSCILGSVVLLVVAAAFGLVANKYAKHGVLLFPRPKSGLQIIDTYRASLLHGQERVFIDARSAGSYAQGHISGAYHLDYYELDAHWPLFAKRFGPRTPLAVYCEGISGARNEDTCSTSRLLAEVLMRRGYSNVILYEQGFAFWEKDGLPVERGAEAASARAAVKMPMINYGRDLIMPVIGLLALLFFRKRKAIMSVQLLLGMIFIIGASSKMFHADKLQVILEAYRILPAALVPFAAACVPWIELFSGVALITMLSAAPGALLVAGMNLFFIPALLYRALLLSHQFGIALWTVNFDCGCGLGENFAWVLILRDAGFLMMAAAVLMSSVAIRAGKKLA